MRSIYFRTSMPDGLQAMTWTGKMQKPSLQFLAVHGL
jgi:hypothetical protein